MRFVRFADGDGHRYGVVDGDGVAEISADPFSDHRRTGRIVASADVRLLSPVRPSKIIGVGANSGDDIPETPVLFLKPPTTLVGPGSPIRLPEGVGQVDYEGELAVVIGRRCRGVRPEDVPAVVFGYTCGNDVTARDLQRVEPQWTRAKGFDTFTPLGPWIETAVDPADLSLQTRVRGELRQDTRTSQLARGVATMVAFASSFMTLLPGDVVLMGAPGVVGPLSPGDDVEVRIEGIGSLHNPVVAAASRAEPPGEVSSC